MSTLTIRLPDDKHERLRALAAQRKISLNKLFEELSPVGRPSLGALPSPSDPASGALWKSREEPDPDRKCSPVR